MVRPVSINRPLVKCRCGKTFSPSKVEAVKLWKHVAKRNGGTNPVRFYECRWSGWHWTRELYDLRECANCRGQFRPTEKDPKATYCDTCAAILAEQQAERAAARERAAAARAAAEERRVARIRARIISEAAPSPAKMPAKKGTP